MKVRDVHAHNMYLGMITKFSPAHMIQAVTFDGTMRWFYFEFCAEWWLRTHFAESNAHFAHALNMEVAQAL